MRRSERFPIKVNDVEKRYGMPLTFIYAITSMTLDTTSSINAEHGGFQALFEQARLGAWIRDGSHGVHKVSIYKQCDDQVTIMGTCMHMAGAHRHTALLHTSRARQWLW